jgi:hypothetical protein
VTCLTPSIRPQDYGSRERSEWLVDHLAQLCIATTQLFWTTETEAAFDGVKGGDKGALAEYLPGRFRTRPLLLLLPPPLLLPAACERLPHMAGTRRSRWASWARSSSWCRASWTS